MNWETVFAVIGYAFLAGCAVAVFVLPIFIVSGVFQKDDATRAPRPDTGSNAERFK